MLERAFFILSTVFSHRHLGIATFSDSILPVLVFWSQFFFHLVYHVGGNRSVCQNIFLSHVPGCYGAKQGGKYNLFGLVSSRLHFFFDRRFPFRVNFSGLQKKNIKSNFLRSLRGKSACFKLTSSSL